MRELREFIPCARREDEIEIWRFNSVARDGRKRRKVRVSPSSKYHHRTLSSSGTGSIQIIAKEEKKKSSQISNFDSYRASDERARDERCDGGRVENFSNFTPINSIQLPTDEWESQWLNWSPGIEIENSRSSLVRALPIPAACNCSERGTLNEILSFSRDIRYKIESCCRDPIEMGESVVVGEIIAGTGLNLMNSNCRALVETPKQLWVHEERKWELWIFFFFSFNSIQILYLPRGERSDFYFF